MSYKESWNWHGKKNDCHDWKPEHEWHEKKWGNEDGGRGWKQDDDCGGWEKHSKDRCW